MMETTEAFDEISCSNSMNRLDSGIASCCSQNSSRTEHGTTDGVTGSSMACSNGDGANGTELMSRIKNLGQENAYLKEELSHAEERIASLERNVKLTSTALDQVTSKYLRLQKENEEQIELLLQAEQREEISKLNLRKLEKSHSVLQKKIEKLEGQKSDILNLKAEKEKIVKRNLEYTKQISQLKSKLAEKCLENEALREKNDEFRGSITQLDESHQQNLQYYENKNCELQHLVAKLQSKINKRDKDYGSPSSPLHSVEHSKPAPHSTPCFGNRKAPHRDSLFSELQASWIDFQDFRNEDPNFVEPKTDVCQMPDLLPMQFNIDDDWEIGDGSNDLINSVRLSLSKLPEQTEASSKKNKSTFSQSLAGISQISNSVLENSQSEIDMKYVTIRENTYTQESNAFTESSDDVDPSREPSSLISKRADSANVTPQRPLLQNMGGSPRRNLFREKSLDPVNQQESEKDGVTNSDQKCRSTSMPIVQNCDVSIKDFETCAPLSTSPKLANNSMVPGSTPSSQKLNPSILDNAIDEEKKPPMTFEQLSIAPTEPNGMDTSLNQMTTNETTKSEVRPFALKILDKPLWFGAGVRQFTISDSLEPRTKRDEARKSLYSYRSRRKSHAVDNVRFRHENPNEYSE